MAVGIVSAVFLCVCVLFITSPFLTLFHEVLNQSMDAFSICFF